MNTQKLTPDLMGSTGHHFPRGPVDPRSLLKLKAWRPALIGLSILAAGIGLILLKSLVQTGAPESAPIEPLELPLPMPAGTLMADAVPGNSAVEVSPGAGANR